MTFFLRSPARVFAALLALLLAGAATGCATPAPLVRLEPRDAADVVWVAGRAAIAAGRAGVRVATAFERQHDNVLGLRLEIENRTNAAFEVSPEDVTFTTCTGAAIETCSSPLRVTDPEATLQALDENQSREEASGKNQQVFATTLVLLSFAADVGSLASGRGGGDRGGNTTGLSTLALSSNALALEAQHGRNLQSGAWAREVWSNVALRRSTLAPGRGVAGLVYVPVDLKAQFVWLKVWAGGQRFDFGFKEIVRRVGWTEPTAETETGGSSAYIGPPSKCSERVRPQGCPPP